MMRKPSIQLLPAKPLRTLVTLFLLSLAAFCFERVIAAESSPLSIKQDSSAKVGAKVWLIVKADERRLELTGSYHYRMNGAGRVNFKEGGRVIEYPEGLTILVNDEKVETRRQVHVGESVRITDGKGETIWKLSPVEAGEEF